MEGDVENFVPLSRLLSLEDGGRRVSRRAIAPDYMDFHKLKWCSELFGCGSEKKTPCLTKKHDAPNDSPAPPAEFTSVMRICTQF